jgi:hypothetical protein
MRHRPRRSAGSSGDIKPNRHNLFVQSTPTSSSAGGRDSGHRDDDCACRVTRKIPPPRIAHLGDTTAPDAREPDQQAVTLSGPEVPLRFFSGLGLAQYLRQPLSTRQTRSGPRTKP